MHNVAARDRHLDLELPVHEPARQAHLLQERDHLRKQRLLIR